MIPWGMVALVFGVLGVVLLLVGSWLGIGLMLAALAVVVLADGDEIP